MTWTYNDWRRQATPAEQLDRLNLHIEEVSSRLTAELSADGKSKSTTALNDYLARLEERADELEQTAGAGVTNGGISLARNRAPR